MKFELTDMRLKVSDEDLLNDLRTVSNNLGRRSLKQKDYCKENGAKFNLKTAIKRFGKWATALHRAGLEGGKSLKGMEYGEKEIRDEVLLDDLIKIAEELNKPDITCDEYNARGKYTSTTIIARFSGWNKAKEKARLPVSRVIHNSKEVLFQNILNIWTLLGRQPAYGEMIYPNSKFHGSTYARRFGSWRASLEAFIEYANSENDLTESEINLENSPFLIAIETSTDADVIPSKPLRVKKTSRNINLRMS